jgi:hypothetical protein
MARIIQRLRRGILTLVLAGSAVLTAKSGLDILQNPTLAPLVTRSAQEIVAATDRLMVTAATPERLEALINARLEEEPRNWVALQALAAVAVERGQALPSAYQPAYDAESGVLAMAGQCAVCAYDAAACSLSNVLICQAPVALTPVGDIAGITRAGIAYASGEQIDQVDLALSVVGLGATAAVLASGGGSAVVKAGASIAKLARRMGRLSPRLVAMAGDAIRLGVDWAALPGLRSTDELARAVRAEAFLPLTQIATELEHLRAATGTTDALHLLPLVESADDARRLARAGEALGPKLVGRAEVLGKARLMRATMRFGTTAWMLISGISGIFLALASMLAGMIQTRLFRALRRG